MAGTTPQGAPAPEFQSFTASLQWTRSRRYHGAHLVGGVILRVYSSRRAFDFDPVIVTLGDGPMLLTGRMSPTDARGIAQALVDAAQTIEQEGRHHG